MSCRRQAAIPPLDASFFMEVCLKSFDMKVVNMLKTLALLPFCLAFAFHLGAQEVICVDSTHYNPDQACLAIFDPVCGCDHSIPSNSCYAFAYNALSCWTGICPEVNSGCEVKFEYAIDGDELHLTNQSIIGVGDSITTFIWNNNYEPFSQEENAVFSLPDGETEFKISLQIRTQNGCDAYCTYRITRSIDAVEELAKAAGPDVFPNPASGTLHIRFQEPLEHLSLFSLDGKERLRRPLGKVQEAEVDVARLASGVYVLVLYDGERRYYRKVVLQ